jgi:hypothetical protein
MFSWMVDQAESEANEKVVGEIRVTNLHNFMTYSLIPYTTPLSIMR